MTDLPSAPGTPRPPGNVPPHEESFFREHERELEDYGGGQIQAWIGHIPAWLLAVYATLFFWALYYEYTYWGGDGPGRPLW
jgi:hypothetical protein